MPGGRNLADFGVYVPIFTPFNKDESLDLEALRKHVVRLGSAGVGLVVQGTTAEAIHLSAKERVTIIRTAREALDGASPSLSHIPIIAGTGSGSTLETITLCKDAAEAGADATLVIAPSFFGATALKSDRTALKGFWTDVADQSPLPVMVYNFPAVTGGIDLDSDLLEDLAAHPNIVGTKLTCGQVGKGHRLATTPKSSPPMLVYTGFSDILFPAMMSGLKGCITGLGNLTPRLVVRLHDTIKQAQKDRDWDKLDEAKRLSEIVSRADWVSSKVGILGLKYAAGKWWSEDGVQAVVRRPLRNNIDDATVKVMEQDWKVAFDMERQLEKEGGK